MDGWGSGLLIARISYFFLIPFSLLPFSLYLVFVLYLHSSVLPAIGPICLLPMMVHTKTRNRIGEKNDGGKEAKGSD
ncbi:hypothetical protein BCR43DRAFT_322925 [Syncephalastrum racemosum]|uniref:Uncharacterized protein n=1 Tax=Syncephalastrum racemosum TaxID=13706 RepID=A0A1X2H7M5_SYNRA|nr:hypothetical protein BCR43DRAFT_322925 [Syncephalastrum racemosum]